MLFLSPEEVLNWGFCHFNGLLTYYKGGYTQKSIALFKIFYRSSPAVIANMWYDLQEKIDVCRAFATDRIREENDGFMELVSEFMVSAIGYQENKGSKALYRKIQFKKNKIKSN